MTNPLHSKQIIIALSIFCYALLLLVACKSDTNVQQPSLTTDETSFSIVDSLFLLASDYTSFDNEIARIYAERGNRLLQKINYKKADIDYYLIRAKIAYYNDNYNEALSFLDSLKHEIASDTLSSINANYYYWICAVNSCVGNYNDAQSYCLKSIEIRKTLNDTEGMSMCYNYLGRIFLEQRNIEKARHYFDLALAYNSKSNNLTGYGNILINQGSLKVQQDSTGLALKLFAEAFEIFQKKGDLRRIALSIIKIAEIQSSEGRYDLANQKLIDAEEIYQNLDEKFGLILVYNLMSDNYLRAKENEKAIKFGKLASNLAIQIESKPLMAESFLRLSKVYKAFGNMNLALQNFEKFEAINTELISSKNKIQIQSLEHQATIREKENRLILLMNENRIKRLQLHFILIFTCLFLIIALIVIVLLRSKNNSLHQQQIILQEKNRVIQMENQLIEQNRKILKNNIELKNKELASKALALLQLNEALQDIGKRINEIKSGKDDEDKSVIRGILHEIHSTTKSNIWEEFDVAFNKVHHSFYDKLLEICPNLSSTEIKIAALLRLNLSTKEIASISFKTESAVKTARSRIRSKLGLNPEDNLITYLLKL